MQIDQNISDLFFNTDVSGAELPSEQHGQFAGYDDAKMLDEANMFLNCLSRLGVPVPSAEELIANFNSRI